MCVHQSSILTVFLNIYDVTNSNNRTNDYPAVAPLIWIVFKANIVLSVKNRIVVPALLSRRLQDNDFFGYANYMYVYIVIIYLHCMITSTS